MKGQCIGFDVRTPEPRREFEPLPGGRSQRFLLRPDVQAPASVDTACWPSMFAFENLPGNMEDTLLSGGTGGGTVRVRAATLRQQTLRLWYDPLEMERQFRANPFAHLGVAVGVTLFTGRRDWPWFGYLDGDPQVSNVPADWRALGFDVADSDLTTFLADSFSQEESAALQPAWGKRLNANGLFDSIDDALEFCDVSEPQVGEHAPLFVYGLFRDASLWKGGGGGLAGR